MLSLPRALLGELRCHKLQGAARGKKKKDFSDFQSSLQIQETLFPKNDSSWWIGKVRSKETVSRYVPNPEDLMAYNYMILDIDTHPGKTSCEHEGEGQMPRDTKDGQPTPRSCGKNTEQGGSPTAFRRNHPCQCFDPRLLASRAGRLYTSAVEVSHLWCCLDTQQPGVQQYTT